MKKLFLLPLALSLAFASTASAKDLYVCSPEMPAGIDHGLYSVTVTSQVDGSVHLVVRDQSIAGPMVVRDEPAESLPTTLEALYRATNPELLLRLSIEHPLLTVTPRPGQLPPVVFKSILVSSALHNHNHSMIQIDLLCTKN